MPKGHDMEQQIKIPPGEAMEGRKRLCPALWTRGLHSALSPKNYQQRLGLSAPSRL